LILLDELVRFTLYSHRKPPIIISQFDYDGFTGNICNLTQQNRTPTFHATETPGTVTITNRFLITQITTNEEMFIRGSKWLQIVNPTP
tara:strand:+ start:19314 stop:19577 length:264 start_codon:yes stop_codon:yes gene_type:complete